MRAVFLFFLAHGALVLFGLPAAAHPWLRKASIPSRLGAAYLLGGLALTLEGLTWSCVGIQWSTMTLGVPLVSSSILVSFCWWRRPLATDSQIVGGSPAVRVGLASVIGAAMAFLGWALVSARATSTDFVLFWGVKGIRFAEAGGIDPVLLGWPRFAYAHPNYPPLVPTVYAWACQIAGEMPWRWAPLTSWFWVIATASVLYFLLQQRLRSDSALAVVTFWCVAMAAALDYSNGGGDAETPLLAFETLACAALVCCRGERDTAARIFAAFALTGAALTKNEGMIGVALILAGIGLREIIEERRLRVFRWFPLLGGPAVALGLWKLFLWMNDLALSDTIRPERAFDITFQYLDRILLLVPLKMQAGTFGISWLLPVAALFWVRRSVVPYLPAVLLCGGLVGFGFVFHLHCHYDPARMILWTINRLTQPALSSLIIWAGLAWFDDAQPPSSGCMEEG